MGSEDLPYGLIVPIVDEVVYDAFCIPVSIFQYGFTLFLDIMARLMIFLLRSLMKAIFLLLFVYYTPVSLFKD